ncbi:MAG TPA: NAD(P)-dependent oxidoreductase [bacterium]|nr:NAD(P)-dependent oxidoreductase [bacterium]
MQTVGVIGLGEMGLPMALRVRGAGLRVVGYDVRDDAGKALAAGGGQVADSAGDVAARADATIVMVRTPAQAESVVLGEDGVLERAQRGSMLIVMSTVGVPVMRRLAGAARRAALRFLDAPVSGGRARAEDGTLTIIVGGAAADVEAARPVLAPMGSQIEHVGDVGAGTTVKMANQVLLTVSLLAAREMAALTGTAGLDTERVWDVLRTCTGTTWVVEHWPVAREWVEAYRPGTSLDILVKDTGLALETAREAGVPAPVLGLASQLIVGLTRDLNPASPPRA